MSCAASCAPWPWRWLWRRRHDREAPPVKAADLTFRGLDRCEACATLVEPGDQFYGLCEACLGRGADGQDGPVRDGSDR